MKYKPMLAKIGKQDLLENKELIFEPKLDGVRALCQVTARGMKFFSRNGHDITAQFPEFNFRASINAQNCVLDGEIIVYDKKGIPNFNMLQGRTQLTNTDQITDDANKHPAHYAVFDILTKNRKELIKLPFLKRREILQETVLAAANLQLLPSTHDGKKLFQKMKKERYEGVIAKEPHAIYSPGKRTRAWQKIKFLKSAECIVIGFTQEKKLISSLALGVYDAHGKLVYAGKVGTGFSQEKINELYPKLVKAQTAKPHVLDLPGGPYIFVKPTIVVEVSFLERTKAGALRHAAFLHLRYDKPPKACTIDQF